MDEREFFTSVAQRTGLSREEAADLTRATLQALAQRLSEGAARELAAALPDKLGAEVRAARGKPSRRSGLADAEKQISDRIGLRPDEVHTGVAAVLAVLREAMPTEAFDRALAQLPGEFRALLPDPDDDGS